MGSPDTQIIRPFSERLADKIWVRQGSIYPLGIKGWVVWGVEDLQQTISEDV